ncbi:hypothetical protein DFJ77DRAFT_455357 [Powellomyces hirtus]|nr:hypothetical protein DFJ77DRAFT_455357 [Powellomyces hirtus]
MAKSLGDLRRDLIAESRGLAAGEDVDGLYMSATRDGHVFSAAEISHSFAAATQSGTGMYATAVQHARRLPAGFARPGLEASAALAKRMYNYFELLALFDLTTPPGVKAREAERLNAKYSKALMGMGADEMGSSGGSDQHQPHHQQRIVKVAACVRKGGLYVMEVVMKGPAGGGVWESVTPTVYVRDTTWATDEERAELEVLAPCVPPPDEMAPTTVYHPLTPQHSMASLPRALRASAPMLMGGPAYVAASPRASSAFRLGQPPTYDADAGNTVPKPVAENQQRQVVQDEIQMESLPADGTII